MIGLLVLVSFLRIVLDTGMVLTSKDQAFVCQRAQVIFQGQQLGTHLNGTSHLKDSRTYACYLRAAVLGGWYKIPPPAQ